MTIQNIQVLGGKVIVKLVNYDVKCTGFFGGKAMDKLVHDDLEYIGAWR